jgi:hypothetical protein
LAELLGRESFNLYGSLKWRDIVMRRGDAQLINVLIARGVIYPGTTSVTLVGFDQDVVHFIDEELAKKAKKRRKDDAHDALHLLIRAMEHGGDA